MRSKSLRRISERFEWLKPVRLSPASFVDQGWMRNIPLYAMGSKVLWTSTDGHEERASRGEESHQYQNRSQNPDLSHRKLKYHVILWLSVAEIFGSPQE